MVITLSRCLFIFAIWQASGSSLAATAEKVLSYNYAGLSREYRFLPAKHQAPRAMVVLLHGIGTGPELFLEHGLRGWIERYRSKGYAFLIPEALDASPVGAKESGVHRAWNGGDPDNPSSDDCCFSLFTRHSNQGRRVSGRPAYSFPPPPDDLGALKVSIDRTAQVLGLPSRKIAVIGISNGGILAYRLQCNLPPGSLGAIVSIQGALTGNANCTLGASNEFLHIHGDQDDIVPFAGGKTLIAPLEPDYIFLRSPVESLATLVKASGCQETEIRKSGKADPEGRASGAIETDWTLQTYSCHLSSRNFQFLTYHGVGHELRVSMFRAALEFTDRTLTPQQSGGKAPPWFFPASR